MATQKADVGTDFATVLNRATELPTPNDGAGKDLPDGYPFKASPHHRVVDTAKEPEGIDGVTAYEFSCKRQVFLIYRAWDNCARCASLIASGTVSLPDEGDHECPHTNVKAYQEITNQILAGKLLYGSEQEVVQKDSSIVVSLKWYEKKIDYKKMRSLARQAAKEQNVPESEIKIPGQQEEAPL